MCSVLLRSKGAVSRWPTLRADNVETILVVLSGVDVGGLLKTAGGAGYPQWSLYLLRRFLPNKSFSRNTTAMPNTTA